MPSRNILRIGRLSDLCYPLPPVTPYLPELIGLASGMKESAAFEVTDTMLPTRLMEKLNEISPNDHFEHLVTAPYPWIQRINPRYKCNFFIGQDRNELIRFDSFYRQPQPHRLGTMLEIGRFLSYPDCCVKAFEKRHPYTEHFKSGRINMIDHRLNNFFIRSASNATILRHYVCDYRCNKSKRYAKEVIRYAKDRFPDLYCHYMRTLKMPLLVVYPGKEPLRIVGDGALFTFDGKIKGNKLFYNKVYYHGLEKGTQYVNKAEGTAIYTIYKKLLIGDSIQITTEGLGICKEDRQFDQVRNPDLVLVKPF